jgi:hypothetical protein
VVLALVQVQVFVFGWEWERKWKPLLALARTHDTILQTLSLRRTARAGSVLRCLLGRLGCLALGRTVGRQCHDSCLIVVRFWQSTVRLEEIRIDPAIYGGVGVVDGVVDSVDGDETVDNLALLGHNSPTSRRHAVSFVSCRGIQ